MSNPIITILMAEDDPDDRLMALEAFQENKLANDLHFVNDGEELLDYLYQRGKYNPTNAARPGLILLDLNMPKKSGLEALQEIKIDAQLRSIPVIVLTTSKAEQDILKSYDLGVSSFIVKPVTFEDLISVIRAIGAYWFSIVVLPPNGNSTGSA